MQNRGLPFQYTMMTGVAQGLFKGWMTFCCSHLSICASITSLFWLEVPYMRRDMGWAPSTVLIFTSTAGFPSLLRKPNASWCFLISSLTLSWISRGALRGDVQSSSQVRKGEHLRFGCLSHLRP